MLMICIFEPFYPSLGKEDAASVCVLEGLHGAANCLLALNSCQSSPRRPPPVTCTDLSAGGDMGAHIGWVLGGHRPSFQQMPSSISPCLLHPVFLVLFFHRPKPQMPCPSPWHVQQVAGFWSRVDWLWDLRCHCEGGGVLPCSLPGSQDEEGRLRCSPGHAASPFFRPQSARTDP